MIDLKGKTAFVAGGARDIGSAICVELARCGAHVAFSYCASKDAADQTAAEVKAAGGKVFAGKMDSTNTDSVNGFVSEAAKQLGGAFDIVVNVSGGLVARKKMHEWMKHSGRMSSTSTCTVRFVSPKRPFRSCMMAAPS